MNTNIKDTSQNNSELKTYTIITGATGGLGTAFSIQCAKQNSNLILLGRNNTKLKKLKYELESINNQIDIVTCACDFENLETIFETFQVIEKYEISILINNAGNILEGSIQNTSLDTILKCIDINCKATIALTNLIVNKYSKNNNLKIITISSLASEYPLPYMATYSATKALLNNYMWALRYEYKHTKLKLLVVEPGAIATSIEMQEAIKAQGLKGRLSNVPAEKIAKKSLKLVQKNKFRYIPGGFNKLTYFVSKLTPKSLAVKFAGKMWKKSQEKRNIK